MSNFWDTRKIYPSITTTRRADWQQMIKDADSLGMAEVAIFPTCLAKRQREEFYAELEKSQIKKIPFVHLREEDMTKEEMDYLMKRFGAEVFNIHPEALEHFKHVVPDYLKLIYIENIPIKQLDARVVKQAAGVCIDFSHLEETRLLCSEVYQNNLSLISKYPRGCAHLSAVRSEKYFDPEFHREMIGDHFLTDLSQMDYLKNYSAELFPPIIAIELENSLEDQLRIKDYIIKLLD